MSRQLVSEETLCELVNGELAQHHGCRDCAIVGVRKLEAPRADGCNWDTHLLAAQHRITGSCLPVFSRTVRRCQELYNVV